MRCERPLAALSRIDAVLGPPNELRRAIRDVTTTGCHYCAPGSGYHVPPEGCPCTARDESLEKRKANDEWLEMRKLVLEQGIEHSHHHGRVLPVR